MSDTHYFRGRAVFLATIMVLSVFGMAVTAVPGAADEQSIDSVDRTINETVVEPGETVEGQIEVQIGGPGGNLTIDDLFEPSFEDVDFDLFAGDFTYNNENAQPDLTIVEDDIVLVGFEPDEGFEDGDTVTLTYRATIPEDVSDGQEFEFDGRAAMDDQEDVPAAGPDTVTVDAPAEPAEYDLSNLEPEDAEVTEGDEPIDISVDVENVGDETGEQDIELSVTDEVDDVVVSETEENVEVEGGETQTVTFEDVDAGALDPGDYTHEVASDDDAIAGSLTVEEAPEEAEFQLSNLEPEDAEVTEGDEPIDISVDVENVGDETGEQDIELEVINDTTGEVAFDDTVEAVELDGGESTTVTFEDVPAGDLNVGNYTHEVTSEEDSIAGSLTVEQDPFAEGDGAGFGPVVAVLALLAAGLLAWRRR